MIMISRGGGMRPFRLVILDLSKCQKYKLVVIYTLNAKLFVNIDKTGGVL